MTDALTLRALDPSDLAFIFNSWLKSYRDSSFGKSISNPMYFRQHHHVIDKLIGRTEIILAVNQDDPKQIYGYVCMERRGPIPILHYLYVKQPYRKLGIARQLFALLPDDPFIYTHESPVVSKFSQKGVYSPYQMFYKFGG